MLAKVISTGESFQILVTGDPGAYLVSAAVSYPDSQELALILSVSQLSIEDKRSLAISLRRGRAALKPSRNPWK